MGPESGLGRTCVVRWLKKHVLASCALKELKAILGSSCVVSSVTLVGALHLVAGVTILHGDPLTL